MGEFLLQPLVYKTGSKDNLLGILEKIWLRNLTSGNGTIYILSGFGNYNGGVRFFPVFKKHVDDGGRVVCFFGGSRKQNMTSRQLVERMLKCGCEIHVINRRKIFHSKCYGTTDNGNQNLIVTSGNFTGPGMSQNVESTIYLDNQIASNLGFDWRQLEQSIMRQNWDIHQPDLNDSQHPSWTLLYDEYQAAISIDQSQLMTMVMTLGHSDTVRINASPKTTAAKGTQYFWLSKDCYDFFPPLDILNQRGYKTTNSCLINVDYVDLRTIVKNSRVTFEAGNNVDFRLGTGKFRYTKCAQTGDMAAITRISEKNYQIRIFRQNSPEFNSLLPYATTNVGIRQKRIGYLENNRFEKETGIILPSQKQFEKRIP